MPQVLAYKLAKFGYPATSEYIAASSQQKNGRGDLHPIADDDDDHETHLAWSLDDPSEGSPPPIAYESSSSLEEISFSEKITKGTFKPLRPAPTHRPPSGTLPVSVILPQRRPGSRRRGFVRAYAPLLKRSDVTKDDLDAFNDGLSEAMKISKTLLVCQVGAFSIAFAPFPAAQVVAMAAHLLLLKTDEMKSRFVANQYLNSANERFFNPRGLVASMITYNPRAKERASETSFDISNGFAKRFQKSEKLETSPEMPETAPLVFPEVRIDQDGNVFKRVGGFLGDFRDRRAQQEYIDANPDSGLSAYKPKFACEAGKPFYLCSKTPQGVQDGVATIKRKLASDIFYLYIAELPADSDLARV